MAVLLAGAGYFLWPRDPAGPVLVVHHGTVGESRWAVLAQQGPDGACLQVRVDGARRELMCDLDWDVPRVHLWHGDMPEPRPSYMRPPSLLRVSFPGSDDVLVVSVLPSEIVRLQLAGAGGKAATPVAVRRLLESDVNYVTAVVDRAQLGEVEAFSREGGPIWYEIMDGPSVRK